MEYFYRMLKRKREDASRAKTPLKRKRAESTTAVVRREMARQADTLFADNYSIGTNISTSGVITSMFTDLARGNTGLNSFNGNSLVVKGITVRYAAHTNQAYNSCRCMLIQWLDSGTPVLSGIFQSTATGACVLSPTLVTNHTNIRVLYDKLFQMAPTAGDGTSTYGQGIFCDKFYIPGSRVQKIRMNSSTAVVQHGNIFLVFVSDDSLISYPVVDWYCRISFTD